MIVFYTVLVLTYLLGLIITLGSEKYQVLKYIILLVVITISVMVAGFRDSIGDTYFYKHSYNLLAKNPVINWEGKDIGFSIFQLILISISDNPQFLVLVTSLITQSLNIITLHTYKNLYELQVYMYITSGYWLTSMNGMRQAMAASIIFVGTPLLIKGKFLYYFFIIIIASSFHSSALVMLPIYFIVREKTWSKKIWLMIGALGIGFILYDILEPMIFNLLGGTNYGHYSEFDEGGSSFIRAFIATLPVIGAYLLKDELKQWPESGIFINMSLLNCIILFFSMYNWIFARLTYYFLPYTFVLLPYLIMKWPNVKEKRILYYGFLVCYFIFFYTETRMTGVTSYSSEYLNFNEIFYKWK